MIEHERLLAFVDELLVQNVKHLEERGVIGDVVHFVGVEMTCVLGAILAPELYCKAYILSHNSLVFIVTCLYLNSLVLQRLLDELRLVALAFVLPATYVEVVLVVALSLAFLSLVTSLAVVTSARNTRQRKARLTAMTRTTSM